MGLSVNTNIAAMNAYRNLSTTNSQMSKSLERLSSGFRINRAADDAAGLAISEKMRGQIKGLAQAQRNIQDGISLVQTAEGSLNEVHSMLQRIRELAVEYKNGTLSSVNQTAIQSEVNQLASEIERIGATTKFNGICLLNTAASSVSFQVGSNDGEVINVAMISLGASIGSSYSTLSSATSLSNIDAAIDAVSTQRSTFGAVQNRLEHSMANVATYQENLVASESRIRDVDMAEETVNLTKNQILTQAGTAMLSQANQSGQGVLSLLR